MYETIITEEEKASLAETSFYLRNQFERVSLAIQFLEKGAPDKENKEIMERMIVRILEHDTDLNKIEIEE